MGRRCPASRLIDCRWRPSPLPMIRSAGDGCACGWCLGVCWTCFVSVFLCSCVCVLVCVYLLFWGHDRPGRPEILHPLHCRWPVTQLRPGRDHWRGVLGLVGRAASLLMVNPGLSSYVRAVAGDRVRKVSSVPRKPPPHTASAPVWQTGRPTAVGRKKRPLVSRA